MAQLSIRIDDTDKSQAEQLFNSLGLNLTTAVNMFIKQALKTRSIPFEVKESVKTREEKGKELTAIIKKKVETGEQKVRSFDLTKEEDIKAFEKIWD